MQATCTEKSNLSSENSDVLPAEKNLLRACSLYADTYSSKNDCPTRRWGFLLAGYGSDYDFPYAHRSVEGHVKQSILV